MEGLAKEYHCKEINIIPHSKAENHDENGLLPDKAVHTSVISAQKYTSPKAHFYMEAFAKGCILKQRLANLATCKWLLKLLKQLYTQRT